MDAAAKMHNSLMREMTNVLVIAIDFFEAFAAPHGRSQACDR
jgi:hypothetical protein